MTWFYVLCVFLMHFTCYMCKQVKVLTSKIYAFALKDPFLKAKNK